MVAGNRTETFNLARKNDADTKRYLATWRTITAALKAAWTSTILRLQGLIALNRQICLHLLQTDWTIPRSAHPLQCCFIPTSLTLDSRRTCCCPWVGAALAEPQPLTSPLLPRCQKWPPRAHCQSARNSPAQAAPWPAAPEQWRWVGCHRLMPWACCCGQGRKHSWGRSDQRRAALLHQPLCSQCVSYSSKKQHGDQQEAMQGACMGKPQRGHPDFHSLIRACVFKVIMKQFQKMEEHINHPAPCPPPPP